MNNKIMVIILITTLSSLSFYYGFYIDRTDIAEGENKELSQTKYQKQARNQRIEESKKIEYLKQATRKVNTGNFKLQKTNSDSDSVESLRDDMNSAENEKELQKIISLKNKDFKNLSREGLTTLLTELNSKKGDMEKPLRQVLSRLAAISPFDALDFYERNLDARYKKKALSAIISTWSKSDAEAAFQWVSESPNAKKNAALMGPIFENLFLDNSIAAMEKLADLRPGEQYNLSLRLGYKLSKSEDFIAHIDQVKSKEIINGLLFSWARNNPKDSLDWLSTESDKGNIEIYKKNIYAGWTIRNSAEAAEWYFNSVPIDERQNAASTIISRDMNFNPQEKVKWIESKEGLDNDALLRKVLDKSIVLTPQFAIDNIEKIKDDSLRLSVAQNLYRTLSKKNLQKAKDFLNQSEFGSKLQE